ncbi:hypothetical protein [Flavobacterium sedimenticola]|uniref:DUF2383 domain-containing protein n=1 Tax=Flavobacterium sedimenticola TaxID=3043286 RepID=A0ABT6XML7_9FLAO|nr:hypothetical protein [Flavobacterium sedimenticola]MDI9256330.1 hypothetical protein [Flavobacterium sedimenticola]
MTKDEIYHKYLERLRLKLIAKYEQLGLRASGKYERELEADVQGDKLIMYGAFHSQFMEHGREPGKYPPRKAIEEWIETKSTLPAVFRENKKQFAFLVARKIAKEGIKVPNEFNAGEVISSVVEDFLANDVYEMIEELGVIYLRRIQSDVIEILKAA